MLALISGFSVPSYKSLLTREENKQTIDVTCHCLPISNFPLSFLSPRQIGLHPTFGNTTLNPTVRTHSSLNFPSSISTLSALILTRSLACAFLSIDFPPPPSTLSLNGTHTHDPCRKWNTTVSKPRP